MRADICSGRHLSSVRGFRDVFQHKVLNMAWKKNRSSVWSAGEPNSCFQWVFSHSQRAGPHSSWGREARGIFRLTDRPSCPPPQNALSARGRPRSTPPPLVPDSSSPPQPRTLFPRASSSLCLASPPSSLNSQALQKTFPKDFIPHCSPAHPQTAIQHTWHLSWVI